ncbi:MAG: RNA polymerase sigma factor [Clostridiales bacterium]|nr:RNA polymerase sigma factor [Clostridiales bacterium]
MTEPRVLGLQEVQPSRDEVLSEWLSAYGDLINRTCCLLLCDRTLAEDATQETFIRAWKSMALFKGNASPKTWLTRIAINCCHNVRRTAWFRLRDRSVAPDDLPLPAPDEDRTLFLTVQQLPEKYRQVIILKYYQGMKLEEAAEVLGISRSAVHQRLQKALKLLRLDFDEGRDSHD